MLCCAGISGLASVEKRGKALVRMKDAGNPSSGKGQPAYTFGKFRLEPDGTLLRGEKRMQLSQGELAGLRLLLAKRGKVVTNAELSRTMGLQGAGIPTEHVAETIASLSKRLGPEAHIQPVQKRGFRLTSDALELTGATQAGLPRVAILPLLAEFGVAEYLGAAVTEGAVDRLSRRRPSVCTLAAKESVATLARRGLSALEIGQAVEADMVLTGTLRALPAHHRMRAEMIQVVDGLPLWTEDVLVERIHLAGLEAQLAQLVAMRLEGGAISITASTERDAEEQEPHDREAYELYQRARFEWQSLERHRMQDAVQHLTHASELDPTLTAARVDLAHLAITEAFHGYLSPAIAVDIVRRATRPGFDDGLNGEAILPAVGWVSFHYDRDLSAALDAFDRTRDLPHDSWISRARVMLALSRRRFDEAAAIINDALSADPFSIWLHARRAWTHHMMGDASASVREVKTALKQFPLHEGVELYAGIILAFNGEAERAVELSGALAQRRPYFDPATAVHAYTLAVAGRGDEARSILERMEWMGRERYVMNSLSAAVYVALGEHDHALTQLRAANEARCPWFFQALADPRLAPLHKLPEFLELEQILVDMERVARND
jgi:TolB-like protein